MITRLYPSEPTPSLCSVLWGANLSRSSNANNDDNPTNGVREDPRTEALREFSYGIILPVICALGIIGNVLNLVVLTRKNMRGTAYIYMRGISRTSYGVVVMKLVL